MKKEKSIRTRMLFGKTILGVAWIITGVSGMFDTLAWNIVTIVSLAGAIAAMVVERRSKFEKDDEMSEHNYMQAKAKTIDVMCYIYCAVLIVTALFWELLENADWNWPRIAMRMFFVLLGIQNLATGIIFRRLEAE